MTDLILYATKLLAGLISRSVPDDITSEVRAVVGSLLLDLDAIEAEEQRDLDSRIPPK